LIEPEAPEELEVLAPRGNPPRDDVLLEIRDLRTWFEVMDGTVRAVDGVSLTLGRGETLGLVGESGCGKSVTALTIMRLLDIPPARIAGGEIWFDGREILSMPMDRFRRIRGNEITMIFQEPMTSLNPVMSIGDQIAESVVLHRRVSPREGRLRANEMLHKVGIAAPERRARQYPHELSGGMRQRVMIALALACDPKLVIADEPTTALDVTIQAQILELIREIQAQTGVSLLMITHDLGVLAESVRRLAVMYAGKVVETGTVEEVLLAPRHPYTEGLLRSIPSTARRGERLDSIQGTVPNPFRMPRGCRFAPRCPYRFEPCTRLEPGLDPVGDAAGRRVACWLHAPRARSLAHAVPAHPSLELQVPG